MDYTKVNESVNLSKGQEETPPALSDFAERLNRALGRYDGLILEVKAKLQTIKRLPEPIQPVPEPCDKPPECAIDEFRSQLYRFNDYNERLESCLNHLREII